jgi:hypothetical protein
MLSTECYLALGFFLGILIGALLLGAEMKRRQAMTKIRAVAKEKEKANGIIRKAKDRRSQGYAELPIALLLMLLAIALLALMAYAFGVGFGR